MEERTKHLIASLNMIGLEKQKRLLAIKRLTEEQTNTTALDDTGSLLENIKDLIDKKQEQLEELKTLEENFQKLYPELQLGDWQDLNNHPEERLRHLYDVLQENAQIVQETELIDKTNISKMRHHLQELKGKLMKVRQGERMLNLYEKNYSSDAWFIDKKR